MVAQADYVTRDELARALDRIDERFDRVDERFDRVDERFDRVDRRSILQGQMIVELQENLKLLRAGQQRLEYKVDAILKHFNIEANEG